MLSFSFAFFCSCTSHAAKLPKPISSTWRQSQEVQATCGCKALCLPQLPEAKTPASGQPAATADIVSVTHAVLCLLMLKLMCTSDANAITFRLFYQRLKCILGRQMSFDYTAAHSLQSRQHSIPLRALPAMCHVNCVQQGRNGMHSCSKRQQSPAWHVLLTVLTLSLRSGISCCSHELVNTGSMSDQRVMSL